jgi:hypothetical protein
VFQLARKNSESVGPWCLARRQALHGLPDLVPTERGVEVFKVGWCDEVLQV